MAEVSVTDKNFDTEVTESKIPVLVDFYAEWCGPCQMQNPILSEIAEEYDSKIKVAKISVDDNPKTASKYNIMSIPTLILFKDKAVVKQMIGAQSKEKLVKEIKRVIK